MFKYFYHSPHDESVYKLISDTVGKPRGENDEFKDGGKSRYRSIHSARVREESIKNKAWPAKTMGVPRIPVDDPQFFLKKQSKRPLSVRHASTGGTLVPRSKSCQVQFESREETEKPSIVQQEKKQSNNVDSEENNSNKKSDRRICFQRPCSQPHRKPAIPHADLGVNIIFEDTKDFIKSNAITVINAPPNKPKEPIVYVDTPKGDKREWLNSGLAPQYVQKKTFTHVPLYITVRKNEFLETLKKKQEEEQAKASNSKVRMLKEDERNKMVEGLKKNWDTIFSFYQKLPLLIDTPGKIKRKTGMEAQMKKLETDIQTLQRHDCIYVSDLAPHSFYAFSSSTREAQKQK